MHFIDGDADILIISFNKTLALVLAQNFKGLLRLATVGQYMMLNNRNAIGK